MLDYLAYQKGIQSPMQSMMGGYQLAEKHQQQQLLQQDAQLKREQAAVALARQNKARTDLTAAMQDGSQSAVRSVMHANPFLIKQIQPVLGQMTEQQANNAFNSGIAISNAIERGNMPAAIKLAGQQAEAYRASGAPNEIWEGIHRGLTHADPTVQKTTAGQLNTLLATINPAKFKTVSEGLGAAVDADTTAKIQSSVVKKAAFDADLSKAQINETLVNMHKNSALLRKAKLAGDTLATEGAIKKIELNTIRERNGLPVLAAGALTRVNTAVDDQFRSKGFAFQADALSQELMSKINEYKAAQEDPEAGLSKAAWTKLRQWWGSQGYQEILDAEYNRLITSKAIASLPQGPATEMDMRQALAAFMDKNANPEALALSLASMANMERYSEAYNGLTAEWISQFGSMGTANRDAMIGGKQVKHGDTLGAIIPLHLKEVAGLLNPAQAKAFKTKSAQAYQDALADAEMQSVGM